MSEQAITVSPRAPSAARRFWAVPQPAPDAILLPVAAEEGSGEIRPIDEHANFVTHGLGFLLSVPAAVILSQVVRAGSDVNLVRACDAYSFSLVGLYAASTLSHAFHDRAWRRFYRMLDQAFIFLLIAGSFTPVGVMFLWSGWWPLLTVAMWGLAGLGVAVVLKLRHLPPNVRICYGFLGWLPVMAFPVLMEAIPTVPLLWLVAGGAFYSVGSLFLIFDHKSRYLHAMWHTFVIGGSVCHYRALLMLIVPM